MPRIPIPTYQQQSSTPLSTPMAQAPMVAVQDNTGEALSQAGSSLGQFATAEAELQRENARAWVSKAASDDQVKWLTRLKQMQDNAQPGAPDFTPQLLGEFDDYSKEALTNAPDFAKPFYQTQLAHQRQYLAGLAITWQAGQQRNNTISQYEQGAQADSVAVSMDPSLYPQRLAARLAAINTSSLPPDKRTELATNAKSQLSYAAGAATVDRDPYAALGAFSGNDQGQVPQGYDWINQLTPQKLQVLRQRAQLNVDKREALGNRAITEADQQISSGVPATSNQWLTWMGEASGTSSEQGVRDRMQSEAEIQTVLREPLADQQNYLNQRIADQNKNGATISEQANLRRLASAVQTNAKTLQDTPLVYAQQHTGQAVAPLDFQAMVTPDGAAAVGPQLRDRVSTIHALQANNPGMVSMHPLLPQEASALSQALNQGTAVQKSGMLGTLYRAFGDPQAFQGAMDQISGTNPFMARMGQRAASYAQSQITNNWFSPDVVQSAGDVAAIALHGDDILRTSGKDGSLKFPVPKDEEFMNALRGKIGDLYRGAGPGTGDGNGFAQDAYAVKSYYVGRAAQDGDISGVVDSGRMDQAIMAVLGQPTNFHGNGQVLAPWGMSADSFSARADASLSQAFQAAGIQDKIAPHMRNVGLIGAGNGVYFPTLAGIPIADDHGKPIAIHMAPDDDTGRNTFGQKISDQIPREIK